MSYRELRALLEAHGCKYVREARHGGHELWICPGSQPFSVPKNLKGEGTLRNILKVSGVRDREAAAKRQNQPIQIFRSDKTPYLTAGKESAS